MLARKSLLIYASNILGALLGAASLYFVGRYIPPEAVGMVAVGLSAATLGSVLATLNFDAAHTKRISEGQDLGDCIRTYAVIRVGLTVLSALLMAGAAFAWDRTRGFADATTLPVLIAVSLYLLVVGVRSVPFDTFFALQQIAKVQALNLADMVAKAGFTILACMAAAHYGSGGRLFSWLDPLLPEHAPLTVAGAALLFALVLPATAGSTAFVAGAMFLGRYPKGRWRWGLARSYARFALPLAVLAPLSAMSSEVDTLMLAYFWSSDDAGYYYAAKRLVVLLAILPSAVASIFFPMISAMAARKDPQAVRAIMTTTLRNLSLVLALLTMFLVAFASAGVEVFLSAPFLPAAPVLQWLAVMTYLVGFHAVYYAVLQGYDRPWECTRASLVLVGGNILFNALLIPESLLGVPLAGLGGPGAALGTAAAVLLSTLMLAARQPEDTRGAFPAGSVLRHLLAAGGVGLLLWLSQPWPALGMADRFYDLIAAGAVGTVLYVGALVAMREVTRKDWLLVKDLLSVTKMRDYVVGELKEP